MKTMRAVWRYLLHMNHEKSGIQFIREQRKV